jgi:hypothetical protein
VHFLKKIPGGVFTGTVDISHLYHLHSNDTIEYNTEFLSVVEGVKDDDGELDHHPKSTLIQPIYAVVNDRSSELSGILLGTVEWDLYLRGILPDGIDGIFVVFENSCGDVFTFELKGPKVNLKSERQE